MYLERLDQITQRAVVAVFSRTKQPGKEMRCVHSQLSGVLLEEIEQEWMNQTGLERHMFLFNKDAMMGAFVDWRKKGKADRQEWYEKTGPTGGLFPAGSSGDGK